MLVAKHEGISIYPLPDVCEVARMIGLSKQEIYKLVKERKINHVRFGKRIKFRKEDVQKFIKDNYKKAEEERDG